jgi:hypothetical protein
MHKGRTWRLSACAVLALAACGGKKGGVGPGSDGGSAPEAGAVDGGPAAFVPVPPSIYAAKVKNLLTGRPLTDDELRLIAGYPEQLALLYPGQLG